MAFGFGSFDLGFSERNPFGLRGRGVDYSRPSGGQVFPVDKTRNPIAQYIIPTTHGFNPVFNPGVQQYRQPIGPSRPVARTVSTTPRAAVAAAKPTLGTPQRTAGITSAQQQARQTSDQDPYQAQLDDLYNSTFGFLNQQRENLLGSQDSILGAVGSQFDAQRPFLDQARDELRGLNQSQQEGVRTQEKNALAEARALYNELGQANRQRYGGTSSVGEFADAIQGREFQRNQNQIQNTTQQNLGKLFDQAKSIETNYQAQVQQLESQKQAAISQARQQFQERLAQIDSARAATQDAKAQAKLEALRELNQRANEIENYKMQLQANLETQALGAAQNIFSAIQSWRAEQGQPVDLQGLPGAQFSQLLGGTQSAVDSLFPQGMFKKPDTSDQFSAQGLFLRPEEQLAAA